MRNIRFYVSCPPTHFPSGSSPPPRPLFLCCHLRRPLRQTSTWSSRLQWAAPDLNSEPQIAVGSTGPHPGSSRADWAAPDLTRGAPERSGQCRTSAATRYVKRYVRKECQKECKRNVRRYVRRYVNRNVR